jgi:hypothetical protein
MNLSMFFALGRPYWVAQFFSFFLKLSLIKPIFIVAPYPGVLNASFLLTGGPIGPPARYKSFLFLRYSL